MTLEIPMQCCPTCKQTLKLIRCLLVEHSGRSSEIACGPWARFRPVFKVVGSRLAARVFSLYSSFPLNIVIIFFKIYVRFTKSV